MSDHTQNRTRDRGIKAPGARGAAPVRTGRGKTHGRDTPARVRTPGRVLAQGIGEDRTCR